MTSSRCHSTREQDHCATRIKAEDEADREIRQIADEGAVSGSILDKLEMGGAE